jgi:hypothetical protein
VAHPSLLAAGGESLRVELCGPWKPYLSSESQTEPHGFHLLASCKQFLQRRGPQRWRSCKQVAGFPERLSHADVAEQLEDRAFGVRHARTIGLAREARNAQQSVGLFVEQAAPVEATRKMFGEP